MPSGGGESPAKQRRGWNNGWMTSTPPVHAEQVPAHPSISELGEFVRAFHLERGLPEGFRPLFVSMNHSYSGEMSESFGLFEMNGLLYEVLGSESSV
jgi:hypothetical protein